MPKRQTDTEILDQAWFQDMSLSSKAIWWFLEKRVDVAGIWKLDIIQMRRILKCKINIERFLREVNKDYDKITGEKIDKKRVILINGGAKIWVVNFLAFQWGNSNSVVDLRYGAVRSGLKKIHEHGLLSMALKEGFLRVRKGSEGVEEEKEIEKEIKRLI